MSSVLRVSDAAAMGLHAMVLLASRPDRRMSNAEIASILGVSAAHLSKVLQRLHKAGMVESTRGPGGGFTLAPGAQRLPLLTVYEAIEGPLKPNQCLLDSPICGGRNCIFGHLLGRLNREAKQYLAKSRLKDLTAAYRSQKK